jgi:peptidyl-prolyl cis-trans isomerase SurA
MRAALLFLALMAASAGAAAQRALLVDRIVAIVNKEVITASELANAVGSAERELRRRGTAPPERAVLERQMLERLIIDKAQAQMARDTGIRVDELQLDRAVQRIAENNRMSLTEFRGALERDGVPFDVFRQDVREQIMLTRLREREVDDKIQVSDSEIDLFLEAMKAAPGERTEYNLAHILVRVPEQASPEQVEVARRRIEQALSQVRAGGDFAQVAATYSNAPEALQGGALGWRAHDRLPELFADALERLQPGEVTPPLRSPAGFHLLKLVDRRVGGMSDAPIPQTRLRHILIRTSEAVSENEARRRLSDLRRRILAKEADFGEMARVHSDDSSSARGGELDWVYPGDTVPDFERAYQELQIGEISEPVRTQFGVHLIQVLERRGGGQ